MIFGMADSSIAPSLGLIPDFPIQIGNVLIPYDFEVVEIKINHLMPLILEKPFLATARAFIDWPNMRNSFANIDKNIFYQAVPAPQVAKQVPKITTIFNKSLRSEDNNNDGDQFAPNRDISSH